MNKTINSIQKVEKELSKIINSDIEGDEKISKIFSLIIDGHNKTQFVMKQGFAGLAIQNADLNAQVMKKNETLENQIKELQEQFKIVVDELNERKEKEKLIQKQKEKRKNRKRLAQRQPITGEIYQILIQNSNKLSYSNSYRGRRLRLALAIMLVTGVRVSELLPLKMEQIETLFRKNWLRIDRSKRGPASHKAFLTREGSRVMGERLDDFEFMWLLKNENSYIFTAENSNKPLGRESFTALINEFLKETAAEIEGQPVLSSHSFRIGFITQLWRDTSDIEFVRQAISHAKIDTTSSYVEDLSDDERKQRMKNI